MILEVVVVVVRQQYCKARYLQVGRELEKKFGSHVAHY